MNRYFVEFGGAMLAYVVLLPVSIFAYRAVDQDGLKAVIAVLPIIPTVLGTEGAVLDQGRGRRVATADQRRALRAMYRTCGYPGCTVRFADCEIHHVIAWIRQRGPTNLDNLLPLCAKHHHDVHEGGWHLTLHPDRTITLHHPTGTKTFEGSTVDVAPTGTADLDLITLAHTTIERLITEREQAAA